ncbi:MSHA biogenesis protein MshI [Vibrio maerlii]|uniref:MSHA biogenesis protein MshI n=1 Tax=Vibrio maerlii TaxID=2231648 RepID=UPI000E3D7EBB|nr:MSHA biogenesis protein MshI [Vibrio maerlii]
MSISSLLSKFKATANTQQGGYFVVLPDAIYFHSVEDGVEDMRLEISGQPWEKVLETALSGLSLSGQSVSFVLSTQHYQTYQIDKPELPKEEWPVALPFLLKDMVAERVTDIVADAVELPNSNKIQAYVIKLSLINQVLEVLNKFNITLGPIIPEGEVWGYVSNEHSDFMLLQRSVKDHFKVGAYVNHNATFQRAIRSVVPPLTGTASSALQIDGLALELQRSVDYLSSQLKLTKINKLLLCCDEEEQAELAEQLAERLSVKVLVAPISEDADSGEVLAKIVSSDYQGVINLYPTHLKPKKENFTFTNVAIGWALLLVVMLSFYGFNQYQLMQVEQELRTAQTTNDEFQAQLGELQEKLAKHKPSPAIQASIERLKEDIKLKRASLDAISRFDDSLQVGYSSVLTSLAELGRNDISLSRIIIKDQIVDLNGLARNPSAIPNWIKQFKQQPSLAGRSFETISIGRNEQDIVTFELKSKRSEAK